jgi:hypothetical protein
LLRVTLWMGEVEVDEDDNEWGPVKLITSPCDSISVMDGRSWSRWRWWWVRTSQADHKSMWQHFGVLRVKCQEASLNRRPSAYTCTQHQRRDTETEGQRNTHDGSSGRPSALLENSIFYRWIAVCNILHILLGLGKTTNSQDRFPGIQHCLHLVLLSHKLK